MQKIPTIATERDSPPNPNTVRPIHITIHDVSASYKSCFNNAQVKPAPHTGIVKPIAKISCPNVIKAAKTTAVSLTPNYFESAGNHDI